MAKNWCGFMPQNEIVMLQWAAMNLTDAESALSLIAKAKAAGLNLEGEQAGEDPDPDAELDDYD